MNIKEIIQKLHITMTDACLQESHFEYCLILNEGIIDAIDALKALDKQEPVAWIYRSTGALFDICPNDADEGEFVPLYTTPPQRKTFNHHEFGYWWFEYGSGLFPLEGEDQEEHSYRVATAAWQAAHGIKGD